MLRGTPGKPVEQPLLPQEPDSQQEGKSRVIQPTRLFKREGDSNPRYPKGYSRFVGGPFQPLTHLPVVY